MSKKFDLEAYKQSRKAADTPLKKDKFVIVDECLHSLIGMPGIPLGHITQVFGKSDTGKTSLMFHTAAQAQKQGVLPVMIITEGKVDWNRAEEMGFDKQNAIVVEDLDYIEEVFKFMDQILVDTSDNTLPMDVMIFWDSIGNTLSEKEVSVDKKTGVTTKEKTMMVAARAISENMRIFSKKLNNTRKISYPHTVGAFFINSGYNKPPSFPGGPTTFVPYGGEKIWYNSSLILKTGKKAKLKAKKDGKDINFGIVSKISVEKNHMTDVSLSGEFVITGDEIIPHEKIAIQDYKDRHKEVWAESSLYYSERNADEG